MEKINLASNEEITRISSLATEKKSGIPFIQNGERRILNNLYHTLVVGEDDVQKDNKIITPMIEQIISAEESFVINAKSNNLYKKFESELKSQGYETICLNFDDPNNSDGFNILGLAFDLYKKGNKDKAIEILENVGHYIFYEKMGPHTDPFWSNSATSLFIGCTLKSFDKDEEITLDKIGKIVDTIEMSDVDKEDLAYNYLSGILMAPPETKGSIISVFKQKYNLYASREGLNRILSNSTFDIKNINNKMAIFIIEGTSSVSKNLVSLIINEIYYICNIYENNKKINLLVNNFDDMCPIKNVESIISLFTDLNVNVTAFIKNFNCLNKTYGRESAEILKLYFKNLIYLYSEDIPTLEYISRMCGSLEYISNLRNIKENEALFIIVRILPFIVNI